MLNLALAEGAQAVVTAGDMTYDSDPAGWWSATEARGRAELSRCSWRAATTTTRPGRASSARRPTTWAAPPASPGPHNAAYKTIFRGLDIVTIKKGDTGTTINNLFGSDNHIWKVCNWHQNQNKMQVGGKGDEMGWAVYETCRQKGAIIITGHEHTYHRTKTMTNTQTQTIDSSCSGGGSLCVGPGRTFVTVVGTGGTGLRAQVRCTPTASTRAVPVAEHQRSELPDLGVDLHHQPGRELRRAVHHLQRRRQPEEGHAATSRPSRARGDRHFTIFAD